jgi:hypothetical protein
VRVNWSGYPQLPKKKRRRRRIQQDLLSILQAHSADFEH